MRQASLWLPQESCSITVEAISAKPHTTLHSALFCALPIIAQLFLFVKRICSVFLCKKVFHNLFSIMCKTVENPVDCEENLHIPAKMRHFSCFYAKKLWKTFALGFSFIIIFYKTIDFL